MTEELIDVPPVGDVDLCVERLSRSALSTGADRLFLTVEAAGDAERTVESIRRLAEEVVPALRAETQSSCSRPSW